MNVVTPCLAHLLRMQLTDGPYGSLSITCCDCVQVSREEARNVETDENGDLITRARVDNARSVSDHRCMAAFLRVWFTLEIVYALCAYGISTTQRDIFYSLEPTGWFGDEDVTLKAIRGAN